MNLEAVIFDLDGLMIESERFSFEVMKILLARYGKCASEAWFEPTIGMDNTECAEFIISKTNLPLTPEAYIQEKKDIMLDLLPEVSKPNPGLLELIQALLAEGMKLGVASNSSGDYVRIALEALGIADLFKCVLSADDVEKAKPAPDIFLLAAQCLGVEPAKCLVLEDSPLGMRAALDAGMSCAVIPNPHLKDGNFEEATFNFPSLTALHRSLPEIWNHRKG